MGEREPTLGEVAEDIAGLRDDLKTFREQVVSKDVYTAHREADDSKREHLAFRLAVVEERMTATGRLAWSGLILPILAMVIGAIFVAALVIPR